jgi:N-acetylmuramoyl-L-alanine amidase
MKRKVDYIVIHCTGASQNQTVESIRRHWREVMEWKNVGYHRLISADGTVHKLADFNEVTNGVKGFNHNSIHICYIGGQHNDNRTEAQKAAILDCIFEALKWMDNPENVIIQGHRDFEGVRKNCPQFSALNEYSWITA